MSMKTTAALFMLTFVVYFVKHANACPSSPSVTHCPGGAELQTYYVDNGQCILDKQATVTCMFGGCGLKFLGRSIHVTKNKVDIGGCALGVDGARQCIAWCIGEKDEVAPGTYRCASNAGPAAKCQRCSPLCTQYNS